MLLLFCVVVCCCFVLYPTPKDPDPKLCLGEGPALGGFWVWRCGCGCCWFGLPWTTFRRTSPPPDRPKFRAFFPSPAGNFILSSLSGRSSRGIWWCLKRRDAQMCALGVLGLSSETPAASGDRRPGLVGLHTTTRELQTCTFERPGASNTTKIPRADHPDRHKKSEMVAGEGKKKREILGSPPFGAPTPSGPTLREFHPSRP